MAFIDGQRLAFGQWAVKQAGKNILFTDEERACDDMLNKYTELPHGGKLSFSFHPFLFSAYFYLSIKIIFSAFH